MGEQLSVFPGWRSTKVLAILPNWVVGWSSLTMPPAQEK
jgi:hypothetical protein